VSGFKVDMLWHPRRQNDPAHIWFRGEVASLTREIWSGRQGGVSPDHRWLERTASGMLRGIHLLADSGNTTSEVDL